MDEKIIEKLYAYKNIYIFGAGKVGKTAIKYLMLYYPDLRINGVLVSDISVNPLHLYGLPVIEAKSVKAKEDSVILISVLEKSQEEIISYLDDLGFHNLLKLQDDMVGRREVLTREKVTYPEKFNYSVRYVQPYLDAFIGIEREKGSTYEAINEKLESLLGELSDFDKVYIPRLVVVLGTKCTLKCKECNNLMPYFKPQKDLDVNKILLALDRLLKVSSSILICELIGGEPFMSKNLNNVLEYLINIPKIEKIEITTNGTLLPNEKTTGFLRSSKVQVRISDYGSIVDKSKLINYCVENNIDYHVLKLGNWISPGGINKRNKDMDQLRIEYGRCSSGYLCKTLFEDRLFSCARSASLFNLGYMKENEYIKIDDSTDSKQIKEFILQDYSIACDYCDMQVDNRKYTEPAIQIV